MVDAGFGWVEGGACVHAAIAADCRRSVWESCEVREERGGGAEVCVLDNMCGGVVLCIEK